MLPASTVWLSPDLDRIMHRAIIILLIILVNRCLWFHCLTKLSLSGSEIFQLKNLVKDFSYDIYTFVLLFWQFLLHFKYLGRCVSFLGFSSYNRLYSVFMKSHVFLTILLLFFMLKLLFSFTHFWPVFS